MELRLPSPEQLRTVYDRDLKESFPPAELKPLRNMEKSWAEGWYKPYCLFDGDSIVGEAFLWLGHPGWALLDYLCVSGPRRSGGIGASILQKLREQEEDTVIFGESEAPEDAPDPDMAVRRLGFYARCGAWDTHYTEHLFDAWFRILVLDCPGCASLAPEAVVEALADCYRRTISPTQWQKHVQFFAPDGSTYC